VTIGAMDRDGIARTTAALSAALRRGDAAAAAALYAADGRVVTSAAELIAGRPEIEAFWQAGIAVGLSQVDLQEVEVQVGPGIALEFGRYALGAEAGTPETGVYVALHRRETDGAWRRAVDVFNPDAPDRVRPATKEEE
jgi:uncharacterized protein (TIGR02246 family)